MITLLSTVNFVWELKSTLLFNKYILTFTLLLISFVKVIQKSTCNIHTSANHSISQSFIMSETYNLIPRLWCAFQSVTSSKTNFNFCFKNFIMQSQRDFLVEFWFQKNWNAVFCKFDKNVEKVCLRSMQKLYFRLWIKVFIMLETSLIG